MSVGIELRPPVGFILKQTGKFRRSLEDLLPLWARFNDTMDEIVQEQFSSHGHGAWPPLAESTLQQKGAHGFSSEPLVRTGTLLDSFHALTMAPQQFIYGTDVEYAHWHQDGGYVAGRPPQRQEIPDPIPAGQRQKLEQQTIRYVDEAAARTFGAI